MNSLTERDIGHYEELVERCDAAAISKPHLKCVKHLHP